MKSILIVKKIENLAEKYTKNLFTDRNILFLKPLPKLKALLKDLSSVPTLNVEYKSYVRQIIRIYPAINGVKPTRSAEIHKSLFAGFTIDLSMPISIGGESKAFYKHVTKAMRYDAVRDRDFLRYAKELGIRTCVYCNANYAISFVQGREIIGKYELDHFKPQSKYPYLCTNFYNLYPVCSNCNKAKLNKTTTFSLYTEDPLKMYPFTFTLNKKSIIRFMLSQNYEDLEITFSGGAEHPLHNTVFKIEPTYSALKDVVEELVWKHKIYNSSYLKSLNNAFSIKFNVSGFNRLILGNYEHPRDIHKRPLSKLTQDIARQLGILK